ncbi:MAG TPA: phosphate ABC transporter permease PstA, partial [Gemmatimonadales bacterium]|nr:phosphate ABC transporter permease PstA [Gemmatimonadales bacterium]
PWSPDGRRGTVNRRILRRWMSNVMVGVMAFSVVLAVVPLLWILGTLILKGASSLNLAFFTQLPAPAGETGGGVAHAIVGTLLIVGTACLFGLPVGIAAGIYCAEYSTSALAKATRFLADVMNGTPSIVVGVFAWTWIVATQKHFSGFAGSAALAVLMVPMIMRTTEELIRLVPHSLREAALALGYSRWRTSLSVVLRTALPGIVTGVLLAVARMAGETAPLLFTALGSQFMSTSLSGPMAALPLVVFTYATGPYEDWHRLAWATALVLIVVVFILSVAARLATRQRFDRQA